MTCIVKYIFWLNYDKILAYSRMFFQNPNYEPATYDYLLVAWQIIGFCTCELDISTWFLISDPIYSFLYDNDVPETFQMRNLQVVLKVHDWTAYSLKTNISLSPSLSLSLSPSLSLSHQSHLLISSKYYSY